MYSVHVLVNNNFNTTNQFLIAIVRNVKVLVVRKIE